MASIHVHTIVSDVYRMQVRHLTCCCLQEHTWTHSVNCLQAIQTCFVQVRRLVSFCRPQPVRGIGDRACFEPPNWVPTASVPPCPRNPCADRDPCKARRLQLAKLLRPHAITMLLAGMHSGTCYHRPVKEYPRLPSRSSTRLPSRCDPPILGLDESLPSVFTKQHTMAVFDRSDSFAF